MDLIISGSGIWGAISTWLMVVLPSFLVGLDFKIDPISITGTRPKWCWVFNSGLVISGISQTLFAIVLVYQLGYAKFSLGIFIFLIGSVSCAFVGVFRSDKADNIHTVFARYFFLFCPLGGMLWAIELVPVLGWISIVGFVFAFMNLAGGAYFYFKVKCKSYTEYWCISLCTVWALHFYFI